MLREIDGVMKDIDDLKAKLTNVMVTIANGDEPDDEQTSFLNSVGIKTEE